MTDAAKKVKRMFGAFGAPPPRPEEAIGNLELPAAAAARTRSERTTQINLRLADGEKKRVRMLAARDGLTIAELVLRAIDLYEKTHGRAPDV